MERRYTNMSETGQSQALTGFPPGPTPSQSHDESQNQKQNERAMPQLSCTLCRDRKLKCNKLVPCANCTSSGFTCVPVYRQRLPRGRHAHRAGRNSSTPREEGRQGQDPKATSLAAANTELSERLRRLESIIMGLGSETTLQEGTKTGESPPDLAFEGSDTRSTTSALPSPMSPSRVLCLDDGTQGPSAQRTHYFGKEVGEKRPWIQNELDFGEVDLSGPSPFDPPLADMFDGDLSALGLFGLSKQPPLRSMTSSGSRAAVGHLCQIYLQNVDPVIKILHRPSLSRWLLQGEKYLGYSEGHVSIEALRSAVCYAAATSMTEHQCRVTFHANKSDFVMSYRKRCEMAISKSNLLISRDISTLQAFLLYLVGRRTHDKSAAVWTLVALATRIAKALDLHRDLVDVDASKETFFDRQIRKRLWLTICLMDLQASMAQSTEPLISYIEAASALAHVQHVNDSDFDDATSHTVSDREGLTDTTFALVTYRVQLAGRLLSFASSDGASSSSSGSSAPGSSASSVATSYSALMLDQDWRQQHVRRFEQAALGLLHFCDPESSTYAWFTWHSTQCLIAAVRFTALSASPRYQTPSSQSHSAATTPQSMGAEALATGNLELLRRAVCYLEKAQLMHVDPRCEGYRWYMTMPWSALATAIAECSVCSDSALVRRAWPVIETWYQNHERSSDVASRGELTMIMRQVREKIHGQQRSHQGGQVRGRAQRLHATGSSPATSAMAAAMQSYCASSTVDMSIEPAGATMPTTSFDMAFEASYMPSSQLLSQHMWDSTSCTLNL